MNLYVATLLGVGLIFVVQRLWRNRTSVVKKLDGPPAPSYIFGHEGLILGQHQVGSVEFPWFAKYGNTFRWKLFMSEDGIMTVDPKALQHVFHTAGYRYPKTTDLDHQAGRLFGPGLITTAGAQHARQRKVINPAFSTNQLRPFSHMFQRLSNKFSAKIRSVVSERGEVMNIHIWLGRITQDAIGEMAFNYKFGAIDDESNELASIMNHVFADSVQPTNFDIVYRALHRSLPKWAMKLVDVHSSKEAKRFQAFQDASKRVSRDLLKRAKTDQTEDPDSMNGKDILSILVRANSDEDEKKRLSEDEVLSQMATVIMAGHETSASTLTWILYELSSHPEHQDRIREEVLEMRSRYEDGARLNPQDYDNMPYLNAVLKEGLRMHPIIYTLTRYSLYDDVIPLSEPVTLTDGTKVTSIPVKAGQVVRTSAAQYNRLKSVWGEDAEMWNPDRFLEGTTANQERINLGVFANLMTFSAGLRGCVGWRFAVMEMQTILAEIMVNFKFAFPPGKMTIARAPAGVMLPLVAERPQEGPQLPLLITPRT